MGGFSLRVKTDEEYERFARLLFNEEIGTALLPNLKIAKDSKEKLKNENLICYLFTNGEEDIGIAACYVWPRINKGVLDIGALTKFRGKLIKEASILAIKDFLKLYAEIELFAQIKHDNKKSLYFSQMLGLKQFIRIKDNYILRFDYGQFNRKCI